MRHGAAGYLTKDLSPDALLRAVRGIRSRRPGRCPASMAADVVQHLATPQAAARGERGRRRRGLSPREEEVLRLLADGLTDREIAERAGHLAAHGRDPRQQRAPQARRAQPRGGRRAAIGTTPAS